MRHRTVNDNTTLTIPVLLHAPSRIPTGDTKVPVVLHPLLFAAWDHCDWLFASPHCKELGEMAMWGISCALRYKAEVCSRLITGIAGSNPIEGVDIRFLCYSKGERIKITFKCFKK
jgi:hypothetical protein